MRIVAWCVLTLACLSCQRSHPAAPPAEASAPSALTAAAPADDQPLAAAERSSRQSEADASATVPVAAPELPWPSDSPPAVKAIFAGSWALREPQGFDQTWFDEAAMLAVPESRLAGRRKWRGIMSQGTRMLVDSQINDRTAPAVAYTWWMLTWNEVVGLPDADVPAVIHFRHRGRVRLWFDGELILDEPPTPDGDWHTLRRAVVLTGSDDVFLVKSGRGGAVLGPSADFELCVSSPDGNALPGQIWQTVRVW